MFDKVLSMPPVLNTPGLWITQDSAYVFGFECDRVLDIPEFWICQDHTGLKIYLNNSWIFMNMPDYVSYGWKCLNMLEYVWICLNLPEWFLFYISPFLHLFYNPLSIWTRDYLFEHLQESRRHSLKEHEAAFLKRHNLIISGGSIQFLFCFRLNIFTYKI